jgi:nitrogen regulatory protein PII
MAQSMKFMTAIIKPVNLDDIVEALKRVEVGGIAVTETKDYGQTGHTEFYRAAEYTAKFVPCSGSSLPLQAVK